MGLLSDEEINSIDIGIEEPDRGEMINCEYVKRISSLDWKINFSPKAKRRTKDIVSYLSEQWTATGF